MSVARSSDRTAGGDKTCQNQLATLRAEHRWPGHHADRASKRGIAPEVESPQRLARRSPVKPEGDSVLPVRNDGPEVASGRYAD